MGNNNTLQRSLTKKITMAAITIAVSLVTVSMFRNTSSILSAIIIPIILALFLTSYTNKEYVFITTTLIFLTLLLITTQTVFMILYVLQGKLLMLLFFKNIMRKLWFFLYIIMVSFSLLVGILLTEIVFSIPLHMFMMRISNNNSIIYGLIILVEGVIVSTLHFVVTSKLRKSLVGTRFLSST